MNTRSQHRFLLVTVTALSMAFMLAPTVSAGDTEAPSQTVSLEPGKHKEVCLKMTSGQGVRYQFTSDRPIAFNIHYHDGPAVQYPVKLYSIRDASDRFVADADQRPLHWTPCFLISRRN